MVPFAGMVLTRAMAVPGHAGMMDSLPTVTMRPSCSGADPLAAASHGSARDRHLRQGPAGDDDGPGGVQTPGRRAGARWCYFAAREGEDAGKVQSIGARFAMASSACRSRRAGLPGLRSPGGGCQFLGTAATSQVVAEALGITLPHAALVPSGQPIWRDMGRRSARRTRRSRHPRIDARRCAHRCRHSQCDGRPRRFRRIDQSAAPHSGHRLAAGLLRPTVDDWHEINVKVPRLVSVLPNGPFCHPTVRAYLAGGVPEVMLHLRDLDLLDLSVLTVSGHSLERMFEWWEKSDRRQRLRERLLEQDGVDPDDVIMRPERAANRD